MKKVLSLTLALVMLISCFGTITANAVVKGPNATRIDSQIVGAANYIKNNSSLFEKDASENIIGVNYTDYWLLLSSGCDLSDCKDEYLAQLKANLTKNNGKIVIEGTDYYQDETGAWQPYSYSYEDFAVYAAVLLTLSYYDMSLTNVYGYDVAAVFKDFDLTVITNPYSFRLAITAASNPICINDPVYAGQIADYLIEKFYVKGYGMNYYGFSCDNTAHFVTSLVLADGAYSEYINEGLDFIIGYTQADGAICDNQWVTTVNADSTALAMMAFAAADNYDIASWYYDKLIANYYNEETGAFQANGIDDLYATKDALMALEYYRGCHKDKHTWDSGRVTKEATCTSVGVMTYSCKVCDATHSVLIDPYHTPAKAVKENVVKATVAKGGSYDLVVYCADCKEELSRKKVKTAKLKVGATAITKLTTGKRSFTATWKKQTKNTTGYQIQYSTNKNFKKGNKTVTVKSNKTVKKTVKNLKAKKTYYVRIRAYKTVNGKKYYSAWSKAKSVKTK